MDIDLNADLGEGFGRWTLGDDAALLDLITSANVACGFHAGDPTSCGGDASWPWPAAAIGAQVGYRDLAGFGRRRIDIARTTSLRRSSINSAPCRPSRPLAGDRVRYLKPHGAFYHTVAHDQGQAPAIVAAVLAFDPSLPILWLPIPCCSGPQRATAGAGSVRRSPTAVTSPTATWSHATGPARCWRTTT